MNIFEQNFDRMCVSTLTIDLYLRKLKNGKISDISQYLDFSRKNEIFGNFWATFPIGTYNVVYAYKVRRPSKQSKGWSIFLL